MEGTFPKESAERRAQQWANESGEAFTVYKDPSGAYLATELNHFQKNPQSYPNCWQTGNFYPEKKTAQSESQQA